MRYASLWLMLWLCACNVSSVRPPAVPELPDGVQLENWPGGRAAVTAYFHGYGGVAEVASGTLSTAGRLVVNFRPVKTAFLTPFVSCSGITVSDHALRLNAFSALTVTRRGTRWGRVAQVSRPAVVSEGLTRPGDYYLQYTYADRVAQIEGRCTDNTPSSFSYALELTHGWNLVVFKLTGEGTLHLSTGPVPVEATWVFSEVAP